jgi:dolichol kinase
MTSQAKQEYDWNTLRKLWHVSGCLVVLVLFYQWKDVGGVIDGPIIMVVLGWLAVAGAVGIDVVRFTSPKNKAALERHPVYGGMLRSDEGRHFNASTYMVLAAAIMVTLWHFGLCREATLMVSIAVLGVADPAAAAARYALSRRGLPGVKAFGLLAFVVAGVAVAAPLCRWRGESPELPRMLVLVLLVGLLEAHTGLGVRLLSPLTRRVQESVSPRTAEWLRRLYPDDNLLIPLATAALMELAAFPDAGL